MTRTGDAFGTDQQHSFRTDQRGGGGDLGAPGGPDNQDSPALAVRHNARAHRGQRSLPTL
jgi:hypothetical protein